MTHELGPNMEPAVRRRWLYAAIAVLAKVAVDWWSFDRAESLYAAALWGVRSATTIILAGVVLTTVLGFFPIGHANYSIRFERLVPSVVAVVAVVAICLTFA